MDSVAVSTLLSRTVRRPVVLIVVLAQLCSTLPETLDVRELPHHLASLRGPRHSRSPTQTQLHEFQQTSTHSNSTRQTLDTGRTKMSAKELKRTNMSIQELLRANVSMQELLRSNMFISLMEESNVNDRTKRLQYATASFGDRVIQEIDYELHVYVPAKDKAALAIINVFGLGAFGIDRCFSGQHCLGLTKCLTFGGLGLWALMDIIAITLNCLQSSPSITSIGYNVSFTPGSIALAYWVTAVCVMVASAFGAYGLTQLMPMSKKLPKQP